MDPITSFALIAAITGVWFYVLYVVIHRAVRNAIRDANASPRKQEKGAREKITDH